MEFLRAINPYLSLAGEIIAIHGFFIIKNRRGMYLFLIIINFVIFVFNLYKPTTVSEIGTYLISAIMK